MLDGYDLIKTQKFKSKVYLGDPLNALKIFNDKYVDELILVNKGHRGKINFKFLKSLAGECFMPLSYGGGISTLSDVSTIINSGFERVIINSKSNTDYNFTEKLSKKFGTSTVIVSIDYKKDIFGKQKIFVNNGKKKINISPIEAAKIAEESGAGELFVQNINRDGVMEGYDIELLEKLVTKISIPIIFSSGAGNYRDIEQILKYNVSAAASSMFVFKGKHKAKLINYKNRPFEK